MGPKCINIFLGNSYFSIVNTYDSVYCDFGFLRQWSTAAYATTVYHLSIIIHSRRPMCQILKYSVMEYSGLPSAHVQ